MRATRDKDRTGRSLSVIALLVIAPVLPSTLSAPPRFILSYNSFMGDLRKNVLMKPVLAATVASALSHASHAFIVITACVRH